MQRSIVISGATQGLGKALYHSCLADGHIVHGCGRSGSGDIDAVDVTDAGAVRRWAAWLDERGIVPDLLINNAGVINSPAPLWEIPAEEFDTVLMTNVAGVTNVIRAFLPLMLRQGRGVIVNMSSGWGRSVDAFVAPYCASKWAVEGLTLALAEELPDGFAAISLNPGIVDTDMLRICWGDGAASFPTAETWVQKAAPYILGLGARDNGKRLTVPG
jgi:NAD(P)-dependent dehydrogenase (short-subunit alcohol dehydrogenase family)